MRLEKIPALVLIARERLTECCCTKPLDRKLHLRCQLRLVPTLSWEVHRLVRHLWKMDGRL